MANKNDKTKHFTVMVIPHSEHSVVTFKLPISILQVLACMVVVAWLSVLIIVAAHFNLLSLTGEIAELRTINREQRLEIQGLVQETSSLRQRLLRLADLEQQVRDLARIDETLKLSLDEEIRLLRLAETENGLEIGQTPASSTGVVYQVAGTVSRRPLQEAAEARAALAEMHSELDQRSDNMATIHSALLEQQDYLNARPSTWPVTGIITSGFGYRRSPFSWATEFHNGVDIAAPHGTPITAPGDGTVTFSGPKSVFGNTVMISHRYGYTTLYAHCSRLVVSVGEEVKRGQVIAYVGSTGRSTGPHLHYELRIDGKNVDPRPYLSPPQQPLSARGGP